MRWGSSSPFMQRVEAPLSSGLWYRVAWCCSVIRRPGGRLLTGGRFLRGHAVIRSFWQTSAIRWSGSRSSCCCIHNLHDGSQAGRIGHGGARAPPCAAAAQRQARMIRRYSRRPPRGLPQQWHGFHENHWSSFSGLWSSRVLVVSCTPFHSFRMLSGSSERSAGTVPLARKAAQSTHASPTGVPGSSVMCLPVLVW